MAKKLFVGGLAWATTSEGLRKAFEEFGEVIDAKVITERETGRSRGFGFVTLADDAAASTAISEMDGKELEGRAIRVNEANQPKPVSGGRRHS
ncbi:MAG: RNA recognition motif domain-containing protein [Bradymonadia bacterium]